MRGPPYLAMSVHHSSSRGRRCPVCWLRRPNLSQVLTLAVLTALFSVMYWIYFTSGYLDHLAMSTTDNEYDLHQHLLLPSATDVAHVLFPSDVASISHRTALYVWCDRTGPFDFINYLALASVMRYYVPNRLLILYETQPPQIIGNWTDSTLDKLLIRCPAFQSLVRMRNATEICSDDERMQQFIMKFMIQFGGLYIGRRTFMTEVTTYFRVGVVEEQILSFRASDNEGFIFVKEALHKPSPTSTLNSDNSVNISSGAPRRDGKGSDSNKVTVPTRYYTAREIRCFDSERFAHDTLHSQDGKAFYTCLILRPDEDLTPHSIISLRSDFGMFARKALFNLRKEVDETRARNMILVPDLCYF